MQDEREQEQVTQNETQQPVLKQVKNFSWLIEGQLAGVAYPPSEEALAALKALGVRAFLSLSVDPLPAHPLQRLDLEAAHLPLAAASAPRMSEIDQALAIINGFLARKRPVAVHCQLGIGRTGTILACYLIQQGWTAAEAIKRVRSRRPGSIDTPEQEAAIYWYEQYRQQGE